MERSEVLQAQVAHRPLPQQMPGMIEMPHPLASTAASHLCATFGQVLPVQEQVEASAGAGGLQLGGEAEADGGGGAGGQQELRGEEV